MSGFLRDLAAKRSEGLVGPDHDPELAEWEEVASRPVYDEAAVPDLAERLRAALTRHDPLPGDRVRWHDGTFGVVHLVAASWLDPGEAVVYRDEAQAHPGAPTWCVEAGSLVAEAPDEAGAVLFVYRGSLR